MRMWVLLRSRAIWRVGKLVLLLTLLAVLACYILPRFLGLFLEINRQQRFRDEPLMERPMRVENRMVIFANHTS